MNLNQKIYIFIIILMYLFCYPLHSEEVTIEGQSNTGEKIIFSGADEGEYIQMDSDDGFITLRGRIKMQSDGKTLFADMVTYNRKTGDISLSGKVVIINGKSHIYAEKCVINIKDNAGVIYNAKSIEEPAFFNSDKIKIINKDSYISGKTNITTCDYEISHYHFKVGKVFFYRDGRVVAYNVIYIVGNLPVFYLPVLVHSDEGTGIITQMGDTGRRGTFMQNTVKYTSGDSGKFKYKFDIYEKLGYYGGFEFIKKSRDFNADFYMGASRFKPVDDKLNNTSLLPEENWFKVLLKSDVIFNERKSSNSFSNINFEWMNHCDFETRFDDRYEPMETLKIIRAPSKDIAARKNLEWVYTIGDRGDSHNIFLSFKRKWLWTNQPAERIEDYSLMGSYMPVEDTLPVFSLNYNGSFSLFEGDKNDKSGNADAQVFNWEAYLGSNSIIEYLLNSPDENGKYRTKYYSATDTVNGYLNLYTALPFWKYFTYTPGAKCGFIAQQVRGPFHVNNEDENIIETRKNSAEDTAEKNTFQYMEASNALNIGVTSYYIQAAHFYRRSYLEREVIEPFVHEKLNYFKYGLYLYPVDGIDMSITTSYDARRKFPFADERLRNIIIHNGLFFDFYRYLDNQKSFSNKNKGLFYSGVAVSNNYTYITKDKASGYNDFDLTFTTGNFSLPGIKLIKSIGVGYHYFHDFRFQFRDMMSVNWNMDADISRLWRAQIGAASQADRAYLYYTDESELGIADDLQNSLYFYDSDKTGESVFSLRDFYINVFHDLHCWELGIFYNIIRRVEKYGPESRDRLIYYEQSVFIALSIKSFAGASLEKTQIFPLGATEEKDY